MKKSIFNIEYLMEKFNISKEEAIKKRRSYNPLCIEYYLAKGMSEEEGKLKISELQSKNAKKHIAKYRENPEKYKIKSNNTLEYYLEKGMSEEEAKIALKERQSTFSLKKCIEKYGEEEGTRRFKERQEKWLHTLNSKSDEEKHILNMSKNVKNQYVKKYGEVDGIEKFKKIHETIQKTSKINKQRKISGDYFFEKYSDKNIAYEEWQKWLNRPSLHSLDWYILKYGKEIGNQKYNEFCANRKIIAKSVINGSYYKNKYGDDWRKFYTEQKIGKASKESLKVFIPVYKKLRKTLNLYDIIFGIKGLHELFLYDSENKKRYLYDFTILSKKIIIEFNGDGTDTYIKNGKVIYDKKGLLQSIHPSYKLTNDELKLWKHPFKKDVTAYDIINYDKRKCEFAIKNGYKILTIWQSDGIQFNIEKVLKFINEN